MKRFLAILLALVLGISMLAACGEASDEQEKAAETEAVTEAPTQAATVVTDEMRDKLKTLIDEVQSKLIAEAFEGRAITAADRRLLIIVSGAVLLGTLLAVLMLTHYQNNAPESEDERDRK